MQDFLLLNYDWLRAFHIISVIAWMAGMLYLPRLFVYHCAAEKGSALSETFKIMERRLLKCIINPAMIATWILGLTMIYANPGMLQGQGWLHVKLLLVLIMSGVHGMFVGMVRKFAHDANTKSVKYYRVMNEIPTVLMIGIVILAVAEPF